MRTAALILPLALLACSGGDKGKGSDDSTPTTGVPSGSGTGTPTGTATGPITSAPPPVAVGDNIVVDEGAGTTIDPIANDTSDVGLSPLSVTLTSYPQHGTLTIQANGIGYIHSGDESTTDSFTYTVQDILGQTSNDGQISVTINPVNDPPMAMDDAATVDEGDATQLSVVANDQDVDDLIDPSSVVIIGQPMSGTVVANPDGTVDYSHDGSDEPNDGFTYQVSDMAGAVSNTASVIITVVDVNDPPIANDDTLEVEPSSSASVRVVNNDVDPDDGLDFASLTVVTQPTEGTVVVDPLTGAIEYTHSGGAYPAVDSFTYTIADVAGVVSNVATVNVTIDLYVAPTYIGSFNVGAGPAGFTNPAVQSCVDTCAQLFGGLATDYECSTGAGSVDNLAKASTWGIFGCQTVAEDFSEDQGTGYDCGAPYCSTSAYVSDNCYFNDFNHCWR